MRPASISSATGKRENNGMHRLERKTGAVTAADRWLCLAVALAVALSAAACLGGASLDWGDDSAAYLLEGFAIADGRLDEQARLNYIMHPSELPDESDGELVYVWAFPLLLAAEYKLVGYDRTDFSSVIYYKIPSAVLLGMTAAVLFLFFRRRFDRKVSLAAALLFGLSHEFLYFVDFFICTDILFLFFAVTAFLLMDIYFAENETKRRTYCGAALGAVFYLAYVTRLNGVTLPLVFLAGQLAQLFREKRLGEWKSGKVLASWLSPYAVFAALRLLLRLFLPDATSNVSDFAFSDVSELFRRLKMLRHYLSMLCAWLGSLLIRFEPAAGWRRGFLSAVGCVPALFAVWGVLRCGWKEYLPFTLLLGGTILGAAVLPYQQGLRYMYVILPLLLLFCLCGIQDLANRIRKGKTDDRRSRKPVSFALAAIACLYAFLPAALYAAQPREDAGPFSADAKAVWNYIREETPEDSTVFFLKPRMLCLNTGRTGLPGANGHTPEEADYYLACGEFPETALPAEYAGEFREIYSRGDYVLYGKN